MPTCSVVLTEHQTHMIETLVKSGRYRNVDEVFQEGLRLVATQEVADAAKLDELRVAVQVGIDAIERGDYKEFADVGAMVAYLHGVTHELDLDAEND